MCMFKHINFHVGVGVKVTPRERLRDVSALLCRWMAGFYRRSAALVLPHLRVWLLRLVRTSACVIASCSALCGPSWGFITVVPP